VSKLVKCTVRIALPVKIACYADVTVVTDEASSKNTKAMAKLFETQLRLWATGACANNPVTLAPFEAFSSTYEDHIEEAFGHKHMKKDLDQAVSLMKDDMHEGTGAWRVEKVK